MSICVYRLGTLLCMLLHCARLPSPPLLTEKCAPSNLTKPHEQQQRCIACPQPSQDTTAFGLLQVSCSPVSVAQALLCAYTFLITQTVLAKAWLQAGTS